MSQFLYHVPSHNTEPIIQTAIINFHDRKVGVPDCLIPHDNLDQHFGIIKLRIRNEIPVTKEIHIDYDVDTSGSMSELCNDRKTKMQHIKFALENMLQIFHKKTDTNISVRIQSFNTEVSTNVETMEDIKSQNIDEILRKMNAMSPNGSTNIEKTLIKTSEYLNKYIKDNSSKRVAHILLTDGAITNGSSNKNYLKTLVSTDYPNIFLGYGLEHDASLLNSLSSVSKYNEYRFIDNLEKAGLIYGDIIHQLLYTAIEDVTLKAENCEIYDYATNTWTTDLHIGHLVSDQQKIYHVRSISPRDAQIAIYGRTIHQTREFEVLSHEIELQTHALPVIMETISCDLTNYLFRQKTQEFLFKTRAQLELDNQQKNDLFDKYSSVFQDEQKIETETEKKNNKETEDLKKRLTDFFKSMLEYVEANKLKDDEFFKMLCDDIYVAIKSFDMEHGLMYTAARQTSQGRQQTYTPRIQETQTTLKRGYTLGPKTNELLGPDLLSQYEPSQNDITPYTTIGQAKLMREVSYTQPLDDATDKP
jgi:hypothetical protein